MAEAQTSTENKPTSEKAPKKRERVYFYPEQNVSVLASSRSEADNKLKQQVKKVTEDK